MNKFTTYAAIFLCLGIMWGGALYYKFRDTPEKQLRKRMDALVELVSKKGPESILANQKQSREIVSYFDEDCIIRLPTHDLSGRRSLLSFVSQLRASSDYVLASYWNFEMDINEPEGVAEMNFRFRMHIVSGENEDTLKSKVQLEWVLKEGEWIIYRATPEELPR